MRSGASRRSSGSGDSLSSSLVLDNAIAAGGPDELLDGPAGQLFDSTRYRAALSGPQLGVVMGLPDVLDVPRNRPGEYMIWTAVAPKRLHRAQVRGHQPTLRPRISAQISSAQTVKLQVSATS